MRRMDPPAAGEVGLSELAPPVAWVLSSQLPNSARDVPGWREEPATPILSRVEHWEEPFGVRLRREKWGSRSSPLPWHGFCHRSFPTPPGMSRAGGWSSATPILSRGWILGRTLWNPPAGGRVGLVELDPPVAWVLSPQLPHPARDVPGWRVELRDAHSFKGMDTGKNPLGPPAAGSGALGARPSRGMGFVIAASPLRQGCPGLEGGAPRRPFFQGVEHWDEPFGVRLRRKVWVSWNSTLQGRTGMTNGTLRSAPAPGAQRR